VGVLSDTGLAPSLGGMSTLLLNVARHTPLEVDQDMRGAQEGGKMVFMVDSGICLFFNGLFEAAAGESTRRGESIAV
jgi:hypothetical protein